MMTALVSLLFITMIPIDCIYPYTCIASYLFVNFLGNNYNIVELNNNHKNYFLQVQYANKLCIRVCSHAPLRSVIAIPLCQYRNTGNSLVVARAPTIDESQ